MSRGHQVQYLLCRYLQHDQTSFNYPKALFLMFPSIDTLSYGNVVGSVWTGTEWTTYFASAQGTLYGAKSLTPGALTNKPIMLRRCTSYQEAYLMGKSCIKLHLQGLCGDADHMEYNLATMELLIENSGKITVHPEDILSEDVVDPAVARAALMRVQPHSAN